MPYTRPSFLRANANRLVQAIMEATCRDVTDHALRPTALSSNLLGLHGGVEVLCAKGEEGHQQQLGGPAHVQLAQQVPEQNHVCCTEGDADVDLRQACAPDRDERQEQK